MVTPSSPPARRRPGWPVTGVLAGVLSGYCRGSFPPVCLTMHIVALRCPARPRLYQGRRRPHAQSCMMEVVACFVWPFLPCCCCSL